ncbi:MAG: exopolysaccharide biosynthesis protein [Devosia sp.]
MTAEATHTPTPLETMVASVLERIREIAEHPSGKLTCNGLIDVVGPDSHILAILVFSVLNLLPGPPGYSVVIGLAIMAFAVMMLIRKPLRLWPFVGERQIPLNILVKLLEFLAGFTRFISRFSSPRVPALSAPVLLPLVAIMAFIFGVAMLVPIPFTNTLPSLGLAIIGVGMLNRDGIAVLAGSAVAIVGLVLLACALWIVLTLTLLVSDVIQHELPGL